MVTCMRAKSTSPTFPASSASRCGRIVLRLAAQKNRELSFVEGDALRLPFGSGEFDAVSIAFGLRNLSSVESGLSELRRVLKPQGWAAILEFSKPTVPGFRVLMATYCTRVLPRIGGIISGSLHAGMGFTT